MSLFVTGTDTGIGKTVAAAVISLRLGWRYWKPVQSGTIDETDSQWVVRHLGADQVKPELYRLQKPLSPHLAAVHEGIAIDLEHIAGAMGNEPLVIEGAGGLMSPLNLGQLQIDLIHRLKVPCVLVASSRLGTINHTMLSLEAMRTRKIEPLGVMMVGENEDNRQAIEHFGKIRVIGVIPHLNMMNRDSLEAAGRNLLARGERVWPFAMHS